jgi:hypothetical protein
VSPSELLVKMSTNSFGARTGSGRSSSAWTSVNVAVLAPIPIASEATITSERPAERRMVRKAYRRSWMRGARLMVRILVSPLESDDECRDERPSAPAMIAYPSRWKERV